MRESRRHEGAARGWWWTATGVVLAIAGFGIILVAVFQSNPVAIPLNTTSFTGAGLAAVGIAAAGIGLDRGAP